MSRSRNADSATRMVTNIAKSATYLAFGRDRNTPGGLAMNVWLRVAESHTAATRRVEQSLYDALHDVFEEETAA